MPKRVSRTGSMFTAWFLVLLAMTLLVGLADYVMPDNTTGEGANSTKNLLPILTRNFLNVLVDVLGGLFGVIIALAIRDYQIAREHPLIPRKKSWFAKFLDMLTGREDGGTGGFSEALDIMGVDIPSQAGLVHKLAEHIRDKPQYFFRVIVGPSGSGKTATADRLAVFLRKSPTAIRWETASITCSSLVSSDNPIREMERQIGEQLGVAHRTLGQLYHFLRSERKALLLIINDAEILLQTPSLLRRVDRELQGLHHLLQVGLDTTRQEYEKEFSNLHFLFTTQRTFATALDGSSVLPFSALRSIEPEPFHEVHVSSFTVGDMQEFVKQLEVKGRKLKSDLVSDTGANVLDPHMMALICSSYKKNRAHSVTDYFDRIAPLVRGASTSPKAAGPPAREHREGLRRGLYKVAFESLSSDSADSRDATITLLQWCLAWAVVDPGFTLLAGHDGYDTDAFISQIPDCDEIGSDPFTGSRALFFCPDRRSRNNEVRHIRLSHRSVLDLYGEEWLYRDGDREGVHYAIAKWMETSPNSENNPRWRMALLRHHLRSTCEREPGHVKLLDDVARAASSSASHELAFVRADFAAAYEGHDAYVTLLAGGTELGHWYQPPHLKGQKLAEKNPQAFENLACLGELAYQSLDNWGAADEIATDLNDGRIPKRREYIVAQVLARGLSGEMTYDVHGRAGGCVKEMQEAIREILAEPAYGIAVEEEIPYAWNLRANEYLARTKADIAQENAQGSLKGFDRAMDRVIAEYDKLLDSPQLAACGDEQLDLDRFRIQSNRARAVFYRHGWAKCLAALDSALENSISFQTQEYLYNRVGAAYAALCGSQLAKARRALRQARDATRVEDGWARLQLEYVDAWVTAREGAATEGVQAMYAFAERFANLDRHSAFCCLCAAAALEGLEPQSWREAVLRWVDEHHGDSRDDFQQALVENYFYGTVIEVGHGSTDDWRTELVKRWFEGDAMPLMPGMLVLRGVPLAYRATL